MEMDCDDPFASLDVDDLESQVVVATPSQFPAGLNVLDTLDDAQSSSKACRHLPSAAITDPHSNVVDPVLIRKECVHDGMTDTSRRQETRGRKRGSDAQSAALSRLLSGPAQIACGVHVRSTPKEAASIGGKASAEARRKRASGAALAIAAASTSQTSTTQALVPLLNEAQTQIRSKPLSSQERLQHAISVVRQDQCCKPTPVEAGVLGGSLKLMSKAVLAGQLNCSRQTVTRRTRLLALVIVLVRRGWAIRDMQALDNLLLVRFGEDNVKRACFLGKFK